MITLYQFQTSPFTEKVRRALNYKGIAFDVHEVTRAKVPSGDYTHVSASGKFPAIIDGDTPISDSTDIIHHLETAHGGPSLFPSDKREAALAHAIEEWADESLYFYEMTMRLSWEHNLDENIDEFSKTVPGVSIEDLKPMIIAGVGDVVSKQGLGRKPREQVISDCNRHFAKLNDMLDGRNWLAGDALSYADLAVIAQVSCLLDAKEGREALATTKNVEPWMARVDAAAPK